MISGCYHFNPFHVFNYPKIQNQHLLCDDRILAPWKGEASQRQDINLSEDVDLQQLAQSLERYSGADVAWWIFIMDGTMEKRWKQRDYT